jgi:DNA-binding winged helix-turn-helix (wHTH) protein
MAAKYPNEDSPTLVGQTGPLNGQRWMIKDSTLIGRDDSCDIIIPDRQVSRHHARLVTTPNGTQIEDLGSKNGTHCNGQAIVEPHFLQDGDVIQVALAQQFVFLSSDATLPLEAPFSQPEELSMLPHSLRLDKRSRRVWVGKEEILPPLSVSQFQLLELLYDNQGEVVSRDDLVKVVWGEEQAVGVSEQALDALIRRLRDRLAAADPRHAYLVTVRGHGVRLENPTMEE